MPIGRPPKPVEQKRLAGNPGHRPLPDTLAVLPVAEGGIPKAPKGFGRLAKQEWRRIFTVAGPWIAPTDVPLVTMFCQGCQEREELRQVIARDGRFAAGSAGQLVTHPAVGQLRALERQLTAWLSLCGFTPSDRARLGLAEVQRMSKLDELRARRKAEPTVVEAERE